MGRATRYNRQVALDAALDLFWRKGFHATSLKDLEAALQMKPGSIYAAFASKEMLFREVLKRYFEKERDTLRRRTASGSPLVALSDHVRQIVERAGAGNGCRACMLVKTVLEAVDAESAIGREARTYLNEMRLEFIRTLEVARTRGEVDPGVDIARLARRYQSNCIALKIEIHRGTPLQHVAILADDMIADLEGLRRQAA